MRGLRQLPWLQLQNDRQPGSVDHFNDCKQCMRTRPIEVRQSIGCGYEPPPTGFPVGPWEHSGYQRHADEHDKGRLHLPICVGYVTTLPEVVEASHAAAWQRNGELTQWCEGQSTPQLRDAISVLQLEYSRVEAWSIANPEKK